MIEIPADALRLDADSLLSKWGFNDGDVPDDYDRWRAVQGLAPLDWSREGDWHAILTELVSTRLVPRLNHAVEVTEMVGNHNPIRAASVDGMPVADYLGPSMDVDWQPEYVDVPFTDVQRVADGSEDGLFRHARTVSEAVHDLGLTPRQAAGLRAIAISMDVPAEEIGACGRIIATGSGVDTEATDTGDGDGTIDRYSLARGRAARRAAELLARPDLVPRTVDEVHWTAIHHQLFQDTGGRAAFDPQAPVADALTDLRTLTPDSATDTLVAVIPVLVEARPFTGSLPFHDGNRRTRRILIQHALERVGLAIDWKWFPDNRERYDAPEELEALLELAVHPV